MSTQTSGLDGGRDVVIVTGPPGAGKTTVSRYLADAEPKSAHVESDYFFRFVRSGFIAPYKREAHVQNAQLMDIISDAVAGYAQGGYVAFWDGIVGPWFLERIAGRLKETGLREHYLVLRPPREVTIERVRTRDRNLKLSGIETMFDQFCVLGPLEKHVMSAGGTTDELVTQCRSALEHGELLLRTGHENNGL